MGGVSACVVVGVKVSGEGSLTGCAAGIGPSVGPACEQGAVEPFHFPLVHGHRGLMNRRLTCIAEQTAAHQVPRR